LNPKEFAFEVQKAKHELDSMITDFAEIYDIRYSTPSGSGEHVATSEASDPTANTVVNLEGMGRVLRDTEDAVRSIKRARKRLEATLRKGVYARSPR
jgi:hypothetical protein